MHKLTERQKIDYLTFLSTLRELCKTTKFKAKVVKLQPCYVEPVGDVIPSPDDLLTLVWDDKY